MSEIKKKLLDKLRRPVHITFISQNIIKSNMGDTTKLINEMVDEELIEESKYGKGYYVVKSK